MVVFIRGLLALQFLSQPHTFRNLQVKKKERGGKQIRTNTTDDKETLDHLLRAGRWEKKKKQPELVKTWLGRDKKVGAFAELRRECKLIKVYVRRISINPKTGHLYFHFV